MKRLKIPYRIGARSIDQMQRGHRGTARSRSCWSAWTTSTRIPTAHWVVVTGIDDETVTVNDPWISTNLGNTRRTMSDYVVPRAAFLAMTAYGAKKERATVLLRRR